MAEEYTAIINDNKITISLNDIKKAFENTETTYKEEFEYGPYIKLNDKRKPIKKVLKNIKQIPEDVVKDFTIKQAEIFLKKLNIEIYNKIENPGEILVETLDDILTLYKDIETEKSIDNDRRVYKLIEDKAPSLIEYIIETETEYSNLDSKGYVGEKTWTKLPYIDINDRNDRKLKAGVNPILFLYYKEDEIYLTLNQTVKKEKERSEKDLIKTGKKLREKHTLEGFKPGPINFDINKNSINKKYGAATVFYKKYNTDSIDENELVEDIKTIAVFFQNELENQDNRKEKTGKTENDLFLANTEKNWMDEFKERIEKHTKKDIDRIDRNPPSDF